MKIINDTYKGSVRYVVVRQKEYAHRQSNCLLKAM